ncbi:MAG: hypothetical protein DSY50_00430 [Desulfobulbus sp.]|nr:MAG: hypothetical protein DSY50_00430 [Desulfobulbus sp.]RUM38781.1 MAG: hypothetical protein DSY58_01630 [Desulfobulbus sp.]RUM40869.1 MAG: hypothetical protein DSY70_02480 [Desulfobulbus sp.]
MIVRFIAWLRSHMLFVKIACYIFLAGLLIGDLFIPRHHAHFIGDVIPGFWAAFGFIACVLIIIVSKWLGTAFLFRPDTYYTDVESSEGEMK